MRKNIGGVGGLARFVEKLDAFEHRQGLRQLAELAKSRLQEPTEKLAGLGTMQGNEPRRARRKIEIEDHVNHLAFRDFHRLASSRSGSKNQEMQIYACDKTLTVLTVLQKTPGNSQGRQQQLPIPGSP
jgi:hypothetical protein